VSLGFLPLSGARNPEVLDQVHQILSTLGNCTWTLTLQCVSELNALNPNSTVVKQARVRGPFDTGTYLGAIAMAEGSIF
jgi:hypothetical protein